LNISGTNTVPKLSSTSRCTRFFTSNSKNS